MPLPDRRTAVRRPPAPAPAEDKLQFRCPSCQGPLTARRQAQRQFLRCPRCSARMALDGDGRVMLAPKDGQAAPPPPPAPAGPPISRPVTQFAEVPKAAPAVTPPPRPAAPPPPAPAASPPAPDGAGDKVQFRCPSCAKLLAAKRRPGTMKIKCPRCESKFFVDEVGRTTLAAPPPGAAPAAPAGLLAPRLDRTAIEKMENEVTLAEGNQGLLLRAARPAAEPAPAQEPRAPEPAPPQAPAPAAEPPPPPPSPGAPAAEAPVALESPEAPPPEDEIPDLPELPELEELPAEPPPPPPEPVAAPRPAPAKPAAAPKPAAPAPPKSGVRPAAAGKPAPPTTPGSSAVVRAATTGSSTVLPASKSSALLPAAKKSQAFEILKQKEMEKVREAEEGKTRRVIFTGGFVGLPLVCAGLVALINMKGAGAMKRQEVRGFFEHMGRRARTGLQKLAEGKPGEGTAKESPKPETPTEGPKAGPPKETGVPAEPPKEEPKGEKAEPPEMPKIEDIPEPKIEPPTIEPPTIEEPKIEPPAAP